MLEDDEIPSSTSKLVNSVLKAPFSIDCEDETIAEATGALACEILPDAELYSVLECKVIEGVTVGVLDWVKTETVWYPRLRFLDPEFLCYYAEPDVWRYNSRQGLVDVVPGDGTWFLHTDGQYGFYRGTIRALARLWYFKQCVWRDWNRYNERHGLPIIKAFVPLAGEANEKQAFVDDVQSMGSEGVVGLPLDTDEWSSYDLELLEPKDQAWGTFQAAIDRADRKIQVLLLGANLGSEVASTGANRAAAEEHGSQLDRIKTKAIAQRLSEDIQKQIFKPFVEVNFGPGKPIPYPCWTTDPPEDKNAKATAIQSLATGLATLGTAGYTITNLDEVVAQYGLEVTFEKPEPIAPVVAPGPPGKKLSLASGDKSDGAVEAVEYAEEVADHVGAESARLLRVDVRTLMSMVRAAESFPDLENRIRVTFGQADPSALADLLQQAMTLAQLDGRYSVAKDAVDEPV